MKIRNGFVTNSSSSSFIIAISGGVENLENIFEIEDKKIKKMIINSIKLALESTDNNETYPAEVLAANMKDINEYIEQEGEYVDKKIVKQYVEWISNGFVIYTKRVNYNDSMLRHQLHNMECDCIQIITQE